LKWVAVFKNCNPFFLSCFFS